MALQEEVYPVRSAVHCFIVIALEKVEEEKRRTGGEKYKGTATEGGDSIFGAVRFEDGPLLPEQRPADRDRTELRRLPETQLHSRKPVCCWFSDSSLPDCEVCGVWCVIGGVWSVVCVCGV